jgi:uncharacterized protein YndB with AHSA1/START domain
MGKITVTSQFPVPLEKVWGYCKDIRHTPEWFPAIVSVRPLGEPTEGVGAEYEFTAKNGGRTVTYRMCVTEWEEGRRLRQEIVPGSGRGLWTALLESMVVLWEYEPTDGGTRLAATQHLKLKGPVDLLTQPWQLIFDRQIYRRALRTLAEVLASEEGRGA